MNKMIVRKKKLIHQRKWLFSMLISAIPVVALALSFFSIWNMPVYAGKEGVFINDNVYFTLEQVDISVGDQAGLFRYTVRLNNNGEETVDMNGFGVKVKTPEGGSLSGQLTGKASSLVEPGQSTDYEWITELPAQTDAEQLKVTVFAWDYSIPDFMRDIGDLSVSAAEHVKQSDRPKTVVNFRDADAVLTDNAYASLQPIRSYPFMKNGNWVVDIDLLAENLGTVAFQIPEGVQFRVNDAAEQVYPGTLIFGTGQNLMPKQRNVITVEIPVGNGFASDSATLEILSKDGNVLASLQLEKESMLSKGETLSWNVHGKYQLNVTVNRHESRKDPDGIRLESTVTVSNPNSEAVELPVLSAQYQLSGIAVAAVDGVTHPAFLSPHESESCRFEAVLPQGADLQSTQLVILEKKSTNPDVQTPMLVSDLQGAREGNDFSQAAEYTLGQPMRLEPVRPLYTSDLQVTLQEMNVHENEEMGYKSVIAKFTMKNVSDKSLPLPEIRTELVNYAGVAYTGNRQTTTMNQLIPNLTSVLAYSYLVPNTEITQPFMLRLKDDQTSATLAEYRVTPQSKFSDETISVFPFRVQLRDWTIAAMYGGGNYTYKFKMDLDIEREENVLVDQNFPNLEFDLIDSLGRVLGSETASFIGQQKLISGTQTIEFKNLKTDQFEFPLRLNMYETFETPAGIAKRLVKSLYRAGM